MSAPFTRIDMEDALTDAIGDSFELDWTARDGAAAAMQALGLWELYEALVEANDVLRGMADDEIEVELLPKLSAALAKARGDA